MKRHVLLERLMNLALTVQTDRMLSAYANETLQEAIRQLQPDFTPEPSPDTVRVRIAVAVDSRNFWAVRGWASDDCKESFRQAQKMVGDPSRVVIVEADVPKFADIPTITGRIASEGGKS
jgi:hypothetical protein